MRQTRLLFLALLLMVTSAIRAYNVGDVITYDGIAYKITKLSTSVSGTVTPGTAEVNGNITKTGNVTIPEMITDEYATQYKVTGVGIQAFKGSSATKVTLPEGIVSISNGAFSECANLQEFNIPATVTYLGVNLIMSSPKVNRITVATGNSKWTDIDGVLCSSDKTSLILYPQGRTSASYAVPESIKTLEVSSFVNCTNLTSIDLGKATTLKGVVFNTCENLTSLTFPAEMTSIPTEEGFYTKCYKLASFDVKSGNPQYSAQDGILYNRDKTELVSCPQAKVLPVGYALPTTVNKIGTRAFYMSNLTTITIPGTVKEIGNNAFEDSKLATITIEEGVATINSRAFSSTRLRTVMLPASASSIGENIFLGCRSLTDITVASGNARYESQDGVMFTKGKTQLYAFPCNQKPNEEYTIPAEVDTICDYAFCYVLKTGMQHIPATVKVLQGGAFESSQYSDIVFDETSQVTHIIGSAFRNMPNLTKLTIPSSVQFIGPEAVYRCNELKEVTFAENSQLTRMDKGVFRNCKALTTVNIKAGSPIKLGENAFENCAALTTVNVESGSLKTIGANAFLNCTKLANMNISDAALDSIGPRAFQNCTSLTTVAMPSSLKSIGESAFTECTKLANVTFPSDSQLESIGRNAFQNSAIAAISLPNSLKNLGVESFHSCKQLTSIDIPAGTTNVASQAFTSCVKLTAINVDENNPKYASLDGMLVSKDKSRLMTFPPGKANSRYTRLPSFITAIDSAFYSCAELTNVTIPKTVTEIGNFAFSNTKNLKSISFLGNIPTLAEQAFLNTKVADITLFVRKNWYEDSANATIIADMKAKGFKDIHPSFIAPAPQLDRGIEYFPTSMNTVGVIAFDTPRNSVIIPEKTQEVYKGATNTYEVATVLDYAFEDNQTTETVVFLGDLEEIGLNAFNKKSSSATDNKIKNLYFVDNTVPGLASESFGVPDYYPFTAGQNIYVKQSKVSDYESTWNKDNKLNVTHKIPQATHEFGGTVCFPFDVKYPSGLGNDDIKPYVPVEYKHVYDAVNPFVRAYSIDDYYVPANVGVLIRSINTAAVNSYCQMDETQGHDMAAINALGYSTTDNNRMVGAVEDVTIANEAGYQYYAFSKSKGNFIKLKDGATFPYFKAYFRLANNAAPAKAFKIVFDDAMVTGIDGIIDNTAANKADEPYYNLNGIQVDRPGKGVYIRGGKKVIIK